jgi:methylamine dehydrogenase light chain
MKSFDLWLEKAARKTASVTSRRSFIGKFGYALVGAAIIPVLPVARAAGAGVGKSTMPVPNESGIEGDPGDPKSCDYWRHCAIDGYACSCCGGSQNSCPPGTEMSVITWLGTCRNPSDGLDYIISYNDCCGKSSCARCLCSRYENNKPLYVPSRSNNVNWCVGHVGGNVVYNCSTAIVVGVATG